MQPLQVAVVLQKLPLYYGVKVLLLLWMFLPQTQGAHVIYRRLVLPMMHKYGASFELKLNELQDLVKEQKERFESKMNNNQKDN